MTHRLFQGRHTRECGPLDIPPLFHPEPPASRTASTPPFQLGFPWACHNRSPCHSCSSSSSSSSLPRILEDYRLTFLFNIRRQKINLGRQGKGEGESTFRNWRWSTAWGAVRQSQWLYPQILLHTVLHSHQRLIIFVMFISTVRCSQNRPWQISYPIPIPIHI